MQVTVRKKLTCFPIPIDTEFIRLDAALKLCKAVSSGGEAKVRIQNGEASVNGESCLQRGRKLCPGDRIVFGGCGYRIVKHET